MGRFSVSSISVLLLAAVVAAPLFGQSGPEPAGWYAGDMHVHRSCGGPPEPIADIYSRMGTENLAVASLLADMGNGEVQDAPQDLLRVNGQDDPVSTPGRIVRWDTEWHWDPIFNWPPHRAIGGHIVALGLSRAEQVWQEYTYPILDWAHRQNGIAGFAHLQYLGDNFPDSLNCCTPLEYPVEVALGAADFISEDVDGSDAAIEAYYRLLNSGFRPGLAAGTDYPCNPSRAVGAPLTYVRVGGGVMNYRNWIEGIAQGRTVVTRSGHNQFLDLKVNTTAGPGDEISLATAGNVNVSVTWTATENLSATIELIQNGVVVASASRSVNSGTPGTLVSAVPFPRSGWLAARVTGGSGHTVHTGAVFVKVNNAPVRANTADPQFYVNWIDNLLANTAAGAVWGGFFIDSGDAARARYQNARALYQQIASEAAGTGPALTGLTVTPANATVGTGSTQQLKATATYSDASTLDVTGQAAWSSSNTATASISRTGLAFAKSPGTTTITASLDGQSGSTNLTVQAIPLTITTTSLPAGTAGVPYSATLEASGGTTPYTWSITSGTLPSGLTLGGGTGIISGTPVAAGTFNFTVQVADAGNPQRTATRALSITLSATVNCPCTIWPASRVPAVVDGGADAPVELGVKFRTDRDGYITGIRFYKSAANTGTHVGNLWTSTGTLLATVTFNSETASGWQEASFSPPVAVTANTTYVASYFVPAGHYSADEQFFATAGADNSPLHALAEGVEGVNGVYRYGASSSFPTSGFHSSNYWVDVVFVTGVGPDTTAPSISSVAPASGATGVSTTTSVTAVFSEAIDQASLNSNTFRLLNSSNSAVPASISYDSSSRTATLTPGGSLSPLAAYRAVLSGGTNGIKDLAGNALSADFSWTFNTGTEGPPAGSCPCTIWPNTAAPATADGGPDSPVELGVKFRADRTGYITGIRFYKSATNTGTHVGNLWNSAGALLASVVFNSETASGWQEAIFTTPVAINANTTYIASYFAPTGHYASDQNFFASAGVDNSPLHALAQGVDGFNGVYRYGAASSFPNAGFNSTNYWVDVVFVTSTGPDTTPPFVSATSPANGNINISRSAVITGTFSEAIDPVSVSGATFQLTDPSSAAVPATVSYSGGTRTATLVPSASLAPLTTYQATLKGGSAGIKDLAGNPLAADVTWSFTTEPEVPPAGNCPCTIWNSSVVPSEVDSNDPASIEVGVKFRALVDGVVSGVRFYKAPTNTGTHIGNLWTSNGTLLATATFGQESASGWQEVRFNTPVAITANTTYVASYFAPNGHYSDSLNYFGGSGVVNVPLSALQTGVDGPNGVYAYSSASAFPTSAYQATSYWVDVVFSPTASTTGPTVASTTPAANSSGLGLAGPVTALFSVPMTASTISSDTFVLRDNSGTLIPAAVTYNVQTLTARLTPSVELSPFTSYTATVIGGANGAKDFNGTEMAGDFSWSFNTGAAPPNAGPGGPILVISNAVNPYTRYLGEILSAEGLNAYTVADIANVSASTLANYDLVILGDMPLNGAQVTMISNWVNGGGRLIAMRPDKQLATLLGLSTSAATLTNAYTRIDNSAGPGRGIVGETMQFHGTADVYALNGASSVATLYSDATSATTAPAVTWVQAGSGQAAAFAYDLARSVVYTRQGNPAWSGQSRDAQPGPIRSDNLFYGSASFDPQADWVDRSKITIPQADEQQRLLANLILGMTSKPMPRFWYLPRGLKAAVVMTGDDHARNGTEGRFQDYLSRSPAGCSVANWECVRGTSYIFENTPITDAQAAAFVAQGFEIGAHVDSVPTCSNWTPTSLETFYASSLSNFATNFPSLPAPKTNRTHCVSWSDYDSQPQVALRHGIRFDTNYYYWPGSWVNDQPGFFTGSGMPMRFADRNGNLIDVYQATTQMTDESSQSFPMTIDALLDFAVGPQGFYGVFTANMHTDDVASPGSDAIIESAQARGVPVVSAEQMLTWLDGRNASSFGSFTWSNQTLTFNIAVGAGANGLQAMLPATAGSGSLTALQRNGAPVSYTVQTIKGREYAVFSAVAGAYQASYSGQQTTPTATLTPTSVTFGDTGVGQTSAPTAVTLSNTGQTAVGIGSISIAGTNPESFAQTNNCGSSLAVGASCTISVTFSPTVGSLRNATLAAVTSAGQLNSTLQGTGLAQAGNSSPASLSFGNVQQGQSSASQAVTLSNTGSMPLTVSSISIAGANPAWFSQTNNCGSSVAVGASCNINVTFTPGGAGAGSGSLTMTTGGGAFVVALSGTGTAQAATNNPASLAFGNVQVGQTSASQTVTLTNTGSGPLSVTGVTLGGTNPGSFSQTNNCPASIAAGGNCTITVRFAPTAAGAASASVVMATGAGSRTTTLSGTGVAQAASRTPASLAFGNVQVGQTSAAQTITLSNTGSGPLSVTGISLTGTNPTSFTQTNNCPASIAAGATCTITVRFVPTATGARSASVTIATGGGSLTTTLSGTGVAQAASRTPASLSFGNVQVGQTSAAQTITLSNTGAGPLSVTGISLTGTNPTSFTQSNNCGTSVAAGATCTITVRFVPTATGARSATVTMTTGAGSLTTTLSGTGVAQSATRTPASLSFGNVRVGQTSAAQTVTLRNTGVGPLSVTGISLTGTNPTSFNQTNNCGTSVAAGGSCTITVRFAPTAIGTRTASLRMATGTATLTTSLTGLGLP